MITKEEELLEENIELIVHKPNGEYIYSLYRNRSTLAEIRSYCENKYGEIATITVIAENPSNGRMFKYDKLHGEWELKGITLGYE